LSNGRGRADASAEPRKLNTALVPHEQLRSDAGVPYSLSAVLSDHFALKDLFVHHEIIPPGRQSSGTHFHSRREEVMFVVRGNVIARCDGRDVALEPGDIVAFGTGRQGAHHLRNESDSDAHVLVVASNPDGDEVSYVRSDDVLG
jgi:uncharacterized cupin superfamily protein